MIHVSNLNDSGAGSLRAALAAAGAGEAIDFQVTGTITLAGTPLAISGDVIVIGLGSSQITIDANSLSRIFTVTGGVVRISGLTLINGADALGGGIHNESTLTLSDIIVRDCVSSDEGGGIWNGSTITLNDCEITDCSASAGDGG